MRSDVGGSGARVLAAADVARRCDGSRMIYSKFGTQLALVSKVEGTGGRVRVQATWTARRRFTSTTSPT
jgi:hypothetical protein